MAHAEYKNIAEAETAEDLTDLSIRFAVQSLPQRFTIVSPSPLGEVSPERSTALKTWLKNHDHGCVRLLAYWSRGSEKASQEWLLISPMTDKRMAKLEAAGLASTVVTGASADEVLTAIRAQTRRGWVFEGAEYPPDSWIRAVISQANRREKRGGLVSLLSRRVQQF